MTTTRKLVPAAFAFLLVLTPGVLEAQDRVMATDEMADEAHMMTMTMSAEDAEYAEVAPGVHKAVLWGGDASGPYGAFTRFEAGTENPVHTHPNDIRMVVLEGAYVFTPEDGEEVRVEAGSFFTVPGGVAHVSAGDAEAGALFYESGVEPFGMEMAEE